MEIKEIEGSLDIAREISNKLFRRVGFLNELGVSKEERIKHIEETLELYQHGKFEELCDALFNALLINIKENVITTVRL
ncbi:MAG: hypothetical protein IIT88_06305 [Acetobacter sp.]|nr:hypothetical protein [Acetobacter sp.]